MQAGKLSFQDQILLIMLKLCIGCRDLDFSEQFDVIRVYEHCMNYLKELCLVGVYSKNTGSINFIAKIEEEQYMCIKITL